MPELWSYTCCLNHATVLCDVTEEDSQSTILSVGMLDVTDTSVHTVCVKRLPTSVL